MNRRPASYTAHAPAELWRLVFRFATASNTSYSVDYLSFEPLREMTETAASLDQEGLRLQTCRSLIRVSRLWRVIAAEFLYEDVRIVDTRALKSLVRGLQRSRGDGLGGFGRHVRRLEIPMRQTMFMRQSSHSPTSTVPPPQNSYGFGLGSLLRFCPRLQILIRPCLRLDAEDIQFWAGLIAAPVESGPPLLPYLQRLEWYETDLDMRFHGNKNTARLCELITQAPSLKYLFISSDRPDALSCLPPCPSLQTLRVNRNHFHSPHSQRLNLPGVAYAPNLSTLILHTTLPTSLLTFVSAVGPQLRVLELAFAPQVVFSTNQMQRLLSRCPGVTELAFSLGAPEISALVAFRHYALRRVRLKLSPDEWYPYKHVVKNQFAILMGASFPNLEELVLHDSTRSLVRRGTAATMLRGMVRRGCRVVYENGENVPLDL